MLEVGSSWRAGENDKIVLFPIDQKLLYFSAQNGCRLRTRCRWLSEARLNLHSSEKRTFDQSRNLQFWACRHHSRRALLCWGSKICPRKGRRLRSPAFRRIFIIVGVVTPNCRAVGLASRKGFAMCCLRIRLSSRRLSFFCCPGLGRSFTVPVFAG